MQIRATTSESEKARCSRPHLRVQSDRRKRAPNIQVRKLCVQVGLAFAIFNDNLRVESGAMFVHLPKMRVLDIGHTIDRSHQSEHCTSSVFTGFRASECEQPSQSLLRKAMTLQQPVLVRGGMLDC